MMHFKSDNSLTDNFSGHEDSKLLDISTWFKNNKLRDSLCRKTMLSYLAREQYKISPFSSYFSTHVNK